MYDPYRDMWVYAPYCYILKLHKVYFDQDEPLFDTLETPGQLRFVYDYFVLNFDSQIDLAPQTPLKKG